jgi:hypothetical protein
VVLEGDHTSGFFGDRDNGRYGIGVRQDGEYRGVGHPEVRHPVDPQMIVDNTVDLFRAHPAGAGLMILGAGLHTG